MHIFHLVNHRFSLLLFALNLFFTAYAQTNYVANTANSSTPTSENTLVGPLAGSANITNSSGHTFVGYDAGHANTTGASNTFIGANAGHINTTGGYNTFLGGRAGQSFQTGDYNVYLGTYAGVNSTVGYRNTFVGCWTGNVNSGSNNTFLGFGAGGGSFTDNHTSTFNIAIGIRTLERNGSGSSNVMIGDSTGYNNTVSQNVFIGSQSGVNNTTGKNNTFLGYQSGYNAVADSNTFIGYRSGYSNTTGRGNTFFGTFSGRGNTTGSHNTYVGNGAGPASSNTDDNVYIGYATGKRDNGSRNTLLGTGADVLTNNLINATAIGAGAAVAVSNALVLGNQTNVGIGTSAPTARLEVNSNLENESGIRLTQLNAASPALIESDKFLSVNKRGDIVLALYRLRYTSQNEWADKVFASGYRLKSLSEVDHYIRVNKHLPGIPSAADVVGKGVDLNKMQTALLEKIEELTLYSIQLERSSRNQQQQIVELKQLVNQLLTQKR